MAKISAAETLAALNPDSPQKLVIVGSAKATVGRHHMLAKIRPSTLARVQSLCFGPMYLVIEHALLNLCDELEASSEKMAVQASRFDPTAEDLAEVEEARKQTAENPGTRVSRMRKKP